MANHAAAVGRGHRPSWADLLATNNGKDVGSVVQSVLWAFDTAQNCEDLDVQVLAREAAFALQSPHPQRILVGSITVLHALDLQLPPSELAVIASDAVFSGLLSAATSQSVRVVAAVARSLCAVVAATGKTSRSDRQEQHTRLRKVVPILLTMLERYPRSFVIQESFAEGCCVLLSDDEINLGSHSPLLWTSLWPLAVHPREEVARAAALCVCRMSWLKRSSRGANGAQPDQQQVCPSTEEAIAKACLEFNEMFKLVQQAKELGGAGAASPMAHMQSLRLLELLRCLILYSRSVVQTLGHAEKHGKHDHSIVVLPVSKILGVVDVVLASTFHSSQAPSSILESFGGRAQTGSEIVARALELAAQVVELAGSAVLPHAARLRKWIQVLIEKPLSAFGRHAGAVYHFLIVVARSSPSVMLNADLLSQLVNFLLAAMQSPAGTSHGLLPPAHGDARSLKRKRKAQGDAADSTVSQNAGLSQWQDVVRWGCATLAKVLSLGAPLLRSPQVAKVCETLVSILWLGLVSPTVDRVGVSDSATSDEQGSKVSIYRNLCRDVPFLVALLDVVHELHQNPRLGSTPLAPNLVNAFVALLDVIVASHPRHVVEVSACNLGSLQRGLGSAGLADPNASVRSRAMQVRDLLLAAAGTLPSVGLGGASAKSAAAISISWPEVVLPPIVDPVALSSGPLDADALSSDAEASKQPLPPADESSKGVAGVPSAVSMVDAFAPPQDIAADSVAPASEQPTPSGGVQDEAMEPNTVPPDAANQTTSSSEPPDVAKQTASDASKCADREEEEKQSLHVGSAAPQKSATSPAKVAEEMLPSTTSPAKVVEEPASAASHTKDDLQGSETRGRSESAGPLELFPDEADGMSEIPDLCMDSPSEDDVL